MDRETPLTPASSMSAPVEAARLIEQVVDYAIIAHDGSGTIESWNAGAERLKGYTADEARGRSFSMFYVEADRRAGLPLRLLDEARRNGRVESLGWRVRKDGTLFWADVIITALTDDEGEVVGFGKVTRDLTAQHELAESLRRSEERFRLLVGQVKDYAIIALDPSGTVESWNTGAERLKGYSADEAIGRSFSMFYRPEDRKVGLPLELLESARRSGRAEHTGWRVRKDESQFWGDEVITALTDELGGHTGFAKVTRDLTESKALEDAQASFIAAIAHDFRTPLTAMKGFTELLRDAPTDKHADFLHRIDVNIDRLMGMIGDLIGYSTIEVDTARRPEFLDLAELARETVEALAPNSQTSRVFLPHNRIPVVADRASMARVVANLVGNALKYSDHGPIVVAVDRIEDRVRLTVSDEGRGIHEQDLETIFEEGERGRLATEDGGTGVGLTSVHRLVAEHGGQVQIHSVLGQGTIVTVELAAPARGRATA